MKKIPISILAVFVSTAMICQATTIGFVGSAAVNADIPVNYVSYAAGGGEGWTVLDGSGATPDIGLIWNLSSSDWEFHNAASFNFLESKTLGGGWDTNANNAVAQLQGPNHMEINFSVPTGVNLTLNSFDIGNATDGASMTFDICLVKDSDSSTNWSFSTGNLNAGDTVSVFANATGDSGEDYTLCFDRTGGGASGGLDNLSFSQSPANTINTTIIGFVGAAAVNANIPPNYCSEVTGSGPGWTSSGTPGIGLTWNGASSDWEFHDASSFNPVEDEMDCGGWDATVNNAVAQMQGPAHLEIQFSVGSGTQLVVNSFDLGMATDAGAEETNNWDISLVKVSDSSTNWTYSTGFLVAGDVEHIIANATGDYGEDYTLNFDRTSGASSYRMGLDNLSFSAKPIPEPCVLGLIAFIGGGILWLRRKFTI